MPCQGERESERETIAYNRGRARAIYCVPGIPDLCPFARESGEPGKGWRLCPLYTLKRGMRVCGAEGELSTSVSVSRGLLCSLYSRSSICHDERGFSYGIFSMFVNIFSRRNQEKNLQKKQYFLPSEFPLCYRPMWDKLIITATVKINAPIILESLTKNIPKYTIELVMFRLLDVKYPVYQSRNNSALCWLHCKAQRIIDLAAPPHPHFFI